MRNKYLIFGLCILGLIFFLWTTYFFSSENNTICSKEKIIIDSINKSGDIFIHSGGIVSTKLYQPKLLGIICEDDKNYFTLLSSLGCELIEENMSLYIVKLDKKNNICPEKKYIYPGREFDLYSNELTTEVKTYYGYCNKNFPNSVIWKISYIDSTGKWNKYIRIAQPENGHLNEYTFLDTDLIIDSMSKTCREIEGFDRSSEP